MAEPYPAPGGVPPRPSVPPEEEFLRARDTLDYIMGLVEAESVLALAPARAAATAPVVVLGGFLGAGKTTLLRRLVSGSHGVRITAIVNDVAALDIDAALVAEAGGDTVSLSNGCVCCSLAGGAARALVDAMGRDPAPDAIVIEASGVADPYALGQVAASVPGLALHGIVTVVDATSAGRVERDYLMRRQVAAADLVLLNKTDLVAPDEAEELARRLAAVAPRAQVLRTVNCAVPAQVILDPPRASPDGATAAPPDAPADAAEEAFRTVSFRAPVPVERAALERGLAGLPDGVVRAKGFLTFPEAPGETVLLQMVGRRWTLEPSTASSGQGRLVLIGRRRDVDWSAVVARFRALGLVPAEEG